MLYTSGYAAVRCSGNYYIAELSDTSADGGWDHDRLLDTGIDYQNRVFRNLDGTTRIVGIWDQTIQTGRTPQGLYYGTEYTEEMINAALRSEDPLQIVPSVDTDGHGTFVASAAAGGAEVGKQFLGAAPEASIAMVKLKPAKII